MIISPGILLRMRNVSDKSFTENQNTCFMFKKFFLKIVERYGTAKQAKDDNMVHALCMLNK
jgi:hypothetical protein